jgi:hypothetical protein
MRKLPKLQQNIAKLTDREIDRIWEESIEKKAASKLPAPKGISATTQLTAS